MSWLEASLYRGARILQNSTNRGLDHAINMAADMIDPILGSVIRPWLGDELMGSLDFNVPFDLKPLLDDLLDRVDTIDGKLDDLGNVGTIFDEVLNFVEGESKDTILGGFLLDLITYLLDESDSENLLIDFLVKVLYKLGLIPAAVYETYTNFRDGIDYIVDELESFLSDPKAYIVPKLETLRDYAVGTMLSTFRAIWTGDLFT